MLKLSRHIGLIILLLIIVPGSYAQSGLPAQKKSQYISEERLKNAKIVEDLIDGFPAELEIVSCRISLSGKDIKYSEHSLNDHNIPDIFGSIHSGHKIFVEYIRVEKKGSASKATSAFEPLELVVTDSK